MNVHRVRSDYRRHPAWDADPALDTRLAPRAAVKWGRAAVEFLVLLAAMAAFWFVAWGLAAVMA